ncbi:MAG TPA: M1 family metallopeptidase [Anaerolineae bacterium]
MLPSFKHDISLFTDATKYDIDLTIDPDGQRVHGTESIRYTNRMSSALAEVMLRLFPNTSYLGGSMSVENVRIDGIPVPAIPQTRPLAANDGTVSGLITDTSILSVALPSPPTAGSHVTLTLQYEISIPQQSVSGYRTFGWADQILSLPDAYAMVPVRDQDGWHVDMTPDYGDIVFAEAAQYNVRITAPLDMVIVATGRCDSAPLEPRQFENGDTSRYFAVNTCFAAPVRDFAIHASRMYQVMTNTIQTFGGEVTVSSYFVNGNRPVAMRVLDEASKALLFYENRFGAYPYSEFKVFASTTTAGGIEYPMVAGILDSVYGADPTYLEWMVAHEVAHQWWYGIVGSDQINEPWLDESLAQYSALLYMEYIYGKDFAAVQHDIRFSQRYRAEYNAGIDVPVDQATSEFDRGLYFPIIYGKGPLFYDEVRRYVGDASFTNWLRTYFEHNRYGIAHKASLLSAADDVGIGLIVRSMFDKWMRGLYVRP